MRVRARCVGVVPEQQVCVTGNPRVFLQRVCARGRGAASGAERAEPSVRAAAAAGRARRRPAGREEEGCEPGTFRPLWKYELSRPKGLPPAAGQEASACARRHPSPTSASRLFLVPGSQGPCVPGETQRRSPTPAGAVCSHAPAAVSPERTD